MHAEYLGQRQFRSAVIIGRADSQTHAVDRLQYTVTKCKAVTKAERERERHCLATKNIVARQCRCLSLSLSA